MGKSGHPRVGIEGRGECGKCKYEQDLKQMWLNLEQMIMFSYIKSSLLIRMVLAPWFKANVYSFWGKWK